MIVPTCALPASATRGARAPEGGPHERERRFDTSRTRCTDFGPFEAPLSCTGRRVSVWERLVKLGIGAGLLGCSSRELEASTHAPATPAELRPRPPGLAVDPIFSLPSATSEAKSDHGLLVLTTPADVDSARATIRRFFGAVLREEGKELGALFEDQASVILDKSGKRSPAGPWWQQRLARLDYTAAAGVEVYRDSRIETYCPEDIARLDRVRLALLPLGNTDLVVRVPIETPRVARTRLFGDEIWFVLRPGPSGYRIVQMQEYFELP